jgi:C4-dicarboxylate-specific signal transduction histidine kinase
LKIEEGTQLILNTAQEALEPVRALIEMLAREAAEDVEAKNPLDWDLEPRWRDNQREIEIALGAIQLAIDDRRRLGLNRLEKLSYKRPYGLAFPKLNALRDFTETVDCCVKDASPSHIGLLAAAVLGAEIGPEQVQVARRKTAELNRNTAEFNRKVAERIREAAGRNREAAEQLDKLLRQATELRRRDPPLIDW